MIIMVLWFGEKGYGVDDEKLSRRHPHLLIHEQYLQFPN
jgi:hypothetical protein